MISRFSLLLGHSKNTCLINRQVRHRRCTPGVSVERKQRNIGNIVVVGV
jgi:hypothetical protein